MNWISIAWAVIASGTIEEIFTHLWKALVGQLHRPLSFRLILQPGVAVILAIRAGLRDARAGRRSYFWAVLMIWIIEKTSCAKAGRMWARFSLSLWPWTRSVSSSFFAGSILAKRCWSRPSSSSSVSGGSRPGQPHREL